MPFTLVENHKFGLVAAEMVYTDFSVPELQLSDGTWLLTNVPFEIGNTWQKWLGTVRSDRLKEANLILVRTVPSGTPNILDGEHNELGKYVTELFFLLQFGGVVECGEADSLKGSFYGDEIEIRQHSVLPQFFPCKGYIRQPVTMDRLEETVELKKAYSGVYSNRAEFARLGRGLNILTACLKERAGQEKLHQAVRAIEAIILPDIGSTKRQFIHRCQTFTKANANAVKILGEIFEMRSDSEHVHDWQKSLQSYPQAQRDDIAWHRTRQIEALARVAYTRILLSDEIRGHFKDETTLEHFWKGLDDATRRKIWGSPFDLDSKTLVEDYDGFGRAAKG